MPQTLLLEAKQVGQNRPILPKQSIPIPSQILRSNGRTTLRTLIAHIVRNEIKSFHERQKERMLLRFITKKQLDQGATTGKIDAAQHKTVQTVSEHSSTIAALQAFVDGFYYVFINDQLCEGLDNTVQIVPSSKITFIRLTTLAGG